MVVWSVMIAIRINDNRESTEIVLTSEHRSRRHAIFRIPNGKTIAKQILALSGNFKIHDDLPISIPAWNLIPYRATHRLLVGRETNIVLREHHRSCVVPVRNLEKTTTFHIKFPVYNRKKQLPRSTHLKSSICEFAQVLSWSKTPSVC